MKYSSTLKPLSKSEKYYREYLIHSPDNEKVKQSVAQLAAATRIKNQPSSATYQYSPPDRAKKYFDLKKSILGMEADVRYRKAGPLYRQLVELVPGDKDILAALADDSVMIAENDGLKPMMEYLRGIAGDDIVIYQAIAELLRQANKENALLAVLQKVNELDPTDKDTIFELALLYQRNNELQKSRKYFSTLGDDDCRSSECIQARASLWENSNCRNMHSTIMRFC